MHSSTGSLVTPLTVWIATVVLFRIGSFLIQAALQATHVVGYYSYNSRAYTRKWLHQQEAEVEKMEEKVTERQQQLSAVLNENRRLEFSWNTVRKLMGLFDVHIMQI